MFFFCSLDCSLFFCQVVIISLLIRIVLLFVVCYRFVDFSISLDSSQKFCFFYLFCKKCRSCFLCKSLCFTSSCFSCLFYEIKSITKGTPFGSCTRLNLCLEPSFQFSFKLGLNLCHETCFSLSSKFGQESGFHFCLEPGT